MATRSRREYLAKLDEVEAPIRREFREFVRASVAAATIKNVEEGVERMDTDTILRDLSINRAALSPMAEAVRAAYLDGGRFEAPAARIMFDLQSPRAEQWIREHSSSLVTRITESQREGIREVLESNMRLGRNPRTTALDIVGRASRTGRRSGGIVGLSGPQAKYVTNMREELMSGDPSRMRNYFSRTRRDRRFDGIVRRAISAERSPSMEDIQRLSGRYSDRLLKLRGNNIARTESIEALNAGRDEAVQQAIDEGVINSELTIGVWDDTGDGRTRPDHRAMDGQRRREGRPFEAPDGSLLMYPGDTSMGASAEMVVNCRCFRRIQYDFIEEEARRAA